MPTFRGVYVGGLMDGRHTISDKETIRFFSAKDPYQFPISNEPVDCDITDYVYVPAFGKTGKTLDRGFFVLKEWYDEDEDIYKRIMDRLILRYIGASI